MKVALFLTLQYVLVALAIAIVLWTGYFAAYPAATRTAGEHPHFFIRGFAHFLEAFQLFAVVTGCWSVAFSFAYMRGEVILNILPAILVALLALPTVARVVRALTLYNLVLYATFVAALVVVLLVVVEIGQLYWVLLPFGLVVGVALLLEFGKLVGPESFKVLVGKRLVAKPAFYTRWTDTRYYAVLGLLVLVEFLFQNDGFSLLYWPVLA